MLELTEEQFKSFNEKNKAIILKYIAQGLIKIIKDTTKEAEEKDTFYY